MIKTIQATKLRSNFKDAMDHIKESKRPLVITERGKPTSVLIDIDAYEDYLMSTDKEAMKELQKSRKEKEKGEVYSFDDVFASVL